MKGQERLDNCIKKGLIRVGYGGQRFLYRANGTGPLWEGRVSEMVDDIEDGNRAYVRLDDSGEWELPENIFVELIFPMAFPVASATSAPAGPLIPDRAEGVEVPIHSHKTKTKTSKTTKDT